MLSQQILLILNRTYVTLCIALLGVAQPAVAFETPAKAAFVIDQTTGTILLSKNADTSLPPASMSKLMTLYIAFEALRDGRLRLDEELPVSKHAMTYGGSTMFLNTTDRVRVEDLLRGIIVLSGNDACAVIAEALSPTGTESGFAAQMNQRAKELGMTKSHFANSNGWPDSSHLMSMRDLALLADRIISDFPDFYPMFAEKTFLFDGRAKSNTLNRNPLLWLDIGADGLKTGHTKEAGYGIVGSAKQGERRVIFVLSGLDSARDRAKQSEAIVNWSFRQFAKHKIANAETQIATAYVWMGAESKIGLVAGKPLEILRPVFGNRELKAQVTYRGPIPAPIKKGDVLAQLIISSDGLPEQSIPLMAAQDVATGGIFERVLTSARVLIRRFSQGSTTPEGAS
jgi:D-alanyl-D-alanine carboxypeptidase (penicillin-binding protein 5/6)